MIVPTNGKNSDAAAAQPISIGSSMRLRASAYVQKTSAAQMAIKNSRRSFTARFSPSLEIPKTARVPIAQPVYRGRHPEKPGQRLRGARRCRAAIRRALPERSPQQQRRLEEEPSQQVADAEEDED